MAVRFGRRGGFEVRSASLHGRYELSVEWRPGCEAYEPVHKLRACCGGRWLALTDGCFNSLATTLKAYFRACRVIGVGDRQKFSLLREFFTPGEWPEVEDEIQRVLEAAIMGQQLPEERVHRRAADDWRFGLFEKWVRAEKGEGE